MEASVTRIKSTKKLLEGSRLKASRLTPVLSVLVSNVKNDICREDKLKVYFKNKKKSGGGKVQDVSIIAKGQAIITFREVEGDFVCKHVFKLCECFCAFGVELYLETKGTVDVSIMQHPGPLVELGPTDSIILQLWLQALCSIRETV